MIDFLKIGVTNEDLDLVPEIDRIKKIYDLKEFNLKINEDNKDISYIELFRYNYNENCNTMYVRLDFDFLIKNNKILRYSDTSPVSHDNLDSLIFIDDKIWLMFSGYEYRCFDTKKNQSIGCRFLFTNDKIEVVRELIRKFQFKLNNVPQIAFLCESGGHLYYEHTAIPLTNIDFDNYNSSFEKYYNAVDLWIGDKNERGISIFHGPPGTGKTTYIRHLASKHELTYIPPDLAHSISSPAFITFLAKNPSRVFVIEDAENIIISDGDTRSSALQNLLNSSDGLLADIIKSKFILTFNTDINNVDKALLRKGRSKVIYKFELLEENVCKKLADKIGAKLHDYKNCSLADVYNSAVDTVIDITKRQAKIGFL